jgi:hypothetical protein
MLYVCEGAQCLVERRVLCVGVERRTTWIEVDAVTDRQEQRGEQALGFLFGATPPEKKDRPPHPLSCRPTGKF